LCRDDVFGVAGPRSSQPQSALDAARRDLASRCAATSPAQGSVVITAAQRKLLHTAKSKLMKAGVLTEENYRALLLAEAGVASSIKLDNRGLNKVLRRFVKMGFVNTAHRPLKRQPSGIITPEQQATIEAQYLELERVTGGYDTFAKRTGFNRRCCKKAMPQTRGEAIKVIEGQKAIIERERKGTASLLQAMHSAGEDDSGSAA
jgi:hypothetical protein